MVRRHIQQNCSDSLGDAEEEYHTLKKQTGRTFGVSSLSLRHHFLKQTLCQRDTRNLRIALAILKIREDLNYHDAP